MSYNITLNINGGLSNKSVNPAHITVNINHPMVDKSVTLISKPKKRISKKVARRFIIIDDEEEPVLQQEEPVLQQEEPVLQQEEPVLQQEEPVLCVPIQVTKPSILIRNTKNHKGKGLHHFHEVDIKDGLRKCPYCDYKTMKGSTLSMHITRIHVLEAGRTISPHTCKYCKQGFQSVSNLEHHVKNHHEIVTHMCPINSCGYARAKNTTTLANHISAKHLKHCYQNDKCLCCGKYIGSSIKYHVAFCSVDSPLCKIVRQ
jgi:hypothetical protein